MNESPKNTDDLTPERIRRAIDAQDRETVDRAIREGRARIAESSGFHSGCFRGPRYRRTCFGIRPTSGHLDYIEVIDPSAPTRARASNPVIDALRREVYADVAADEED